MPKSVDTEGDFGQFRPSQQSDDDECVRLVRYDFLLVFSVVTTGLDGAVVEVNRSVTPTTRTTSPQSNLRRARRKGPISSDDSQVQGRPSPGKPL